MSTMSRVAGDTVTSVIVSHVVDVLADSSLATVTCDEFALLSWPEGELYDKSIVDRSASSLQSPLVVVALEPIVFCISEQL